MSPLIESTKQVAAGLDLDPPVTPADLERAESALSFPLPALLREHYAGVSDGGIGPSGGLMGLMASHPTPAYEDPSVVGTYLGFVSAAGSALPAWPRALLPICYEGCQTYVCVDCSATECPVVRFDPADEPVFGPESFQQVSGRLEQWWDDWLQSLPPT